MGRGGDFVVEAAGLQAFPPKAEAQPDPTKGDHHWRHRGDAIDVNRISQNGEVFYP